MSIGINGWRFPDYTDSPDVPRDLGNLGNDIADFIEANPGPQGEQGIPATVTVGTVTTVASDVAANVIDVGPNSHEAILNFVIPRGIDGVIGGPGPANVLTIGTVQSGDLPEATITGSAPEQVLNLILPKGDAGAVGETGSIGPKGDAAATISVLSTSTGNAGTDASVTNSGTSSDVQLNFVIPRGADGVAGIEGPAGPAGTDASLTNIESVISITTPSGTAYGVTSDWYPAADNFKSIGAVTNNITVFENHRWKTIYSNTGVISTSDVNSKDNITESNLGLDFINLLNPVSYNYKVGENIVTKDDNNNLIITPKPGSRTHYGLIAQEVKEVLDNAGIEDFGGWILLNKEDEDSEQALRYEEFISPLIKAVQELTARVQALEAR